MNCATYSRDGHPSTVKRKRHSMNLQMNVKGCFLSHLISGEVDVGANSVGGKPSATSQNSKPPATTQRYALLISGNISTEIG